MGTSHAKRRLSFQECRSQILLHFARSISLAPTDFKVDLTGQRRELKKGSIPSMFEWAPEKVSLREERLKIRTENISHAQTKEAKHSMEKMLQDRDSPMLLKESLSDCKTVKFVGPPTLGEFVENLRLTVFRETKPNETKRNQTRRKGIYYTCKS